ncbi:MAG TPA: AAA family ATPase [Archangium sp.]|nr:AAA family ATPase [Archangium sp.]
MAFLAPEQVLQPAEARGMGRALIVTALGSEIRSVLAHLKRIGSVRGRGGTVYECGEFKGDERDWLIVVAQSGPGNQAAQAVTLTAHHDFDSFDVMMFVGVAGSRKSDVPIGSVIASNRVYSPYAGKFEPQGASSRPLVFQAPTELVQLAMKVERDETWQSRILPVKGGLPLGADNYPQPFPPSAFVAPIVSVEAVMANPNSELEKHIALHFGDAHGVEMEGFGAAFGAHVERTSAIIIRGVSDMTARKKAKTDAFLQPIAVAHASAFAFELLNLLEPARRMSRARIAGPSPSEPVMADGPEKALVEHGVEPPQEGPPKQRVDSPPAISRVLQASSMVPRPTATAAAPRRGRFVLNLAGSLADYPPERLEVLLVAIRAASGDNTVEIVKIEEGSVRLFVSAQTADLATLSSPQVSEAMKEVGAELLGVAEEETFHNLQATKADLEQASHELLAWPQTLPGGERLERPELGQVIQKLDEFDSSATVVLGPPGSGKSALLARIAQEMVARSWPMLGIKADVLDPEIADEAGLQRQLMLDEPPSRLLALMAGFGPVVLIIDQLDALAGFVDLRTGRLNVLLNLLRRFGRRRNVHVIASARTFEFNHDVRLRSIEADTLSLELPPWREVLPVLAARNLNPKGWPPDAQETLRTPQHLATFLRLVDSGAAEPFQNYQAMLERLWSERVLQASNGERLARLATDIAEAMAEEESLWLARSRYDDYAKDLRDLERLEILTPSADGLAIGFSHQTLYDYVLARSFARGKGRLSAYVAGREASLFLRPKLWVALTYLRNVELSTYEREMATIWRSEGLRPHLKLLLIEFMGQQKEPTETERQLMKPVLEAGPERASAFRAIVGSPGWFAAVASSAIAVAMGESEQAAWLVTAVLQQAWAFAPERVLSLIQQRWAPDSRFDAHNWTVIAEVPEWPDAIADLAITILNRTQIAPFHVEHVVAHLGVNQPEMALRLVRARLDRDLTAAIQIATERAKTPRTTHEDLADHMAWLMKKSPEKPLENLIEQSQNWDVLASLAETAPGPFMTAMWPWFTHVLQALADIEPRLEGWPTYPLKWKLDFRFDGEDDGLDLPQPPILSAFRMAAEGLAKTPEFLRPWVAENLSLEAAPAQRLLAYALAQDGKTYAQDAFDFLMADSRRFYLGGLADESGTTKALIRAASPHWSQEMHDAFVQRVRTYRPPAISDQDAESKRSWVRRLRKLRLGLLKALPQENLDQEVKSHIQQESRVFPDERIGVSSSGARWIGSPISTKAMLKASDDDILNAFREIPDRTEWSHPRHFLQGGNIQLSRAFADFAKHQPERAARLIARFDPEIGSRASGLALDAMGETAAPDLVVTTFLNVARRGFVGEEFRGSAARAIERLVDRKVAIGEEVVTVLRSWLGEVPEPKTDEPDDDEARGRRKKDGEQNVHSILWDRHHFSTLPHGNFPVLETLTRVLLAREEHNRIVEIWEEHLARRENPKVWRALLRLLPYILPTDEAARGRLIGGIFRRYPQVAESLEAILVLGYAQWWARDQVREVLDSWRGRDDPWLQQALGEIGALVALVQPDLRWAVDLLNEGLASEASAERKIGVAFSAANMWDNVKFRTRANAVLLTLIPQADAKLWSAILDIFRVVEDMGDALEVASLLDAMVAHIRKARGQTNTFLVDRLQGLLPEHAVAVGHLTKGIIANLSDELGDIRTGAAVAAPELVDIAITLHRLGGPTRELGVQLFEELLRIDAYSARATLEEIDSRFRTGPAPRRRPRLTRRSAKAKRRRHAGS